MAHFKEVREQVKETHMGESHMSPQPLDQVKEADDVSHVEVLAHVKQSSALRKRLTQLLWMLG